jgi:hypothetical protein
VHPQRQVLEGDAQGFLVGGQQLIEQRFDLAAVRTFKIGKDNQGNRCIDLAQDRSAADVDSLVEADVNGCVVIGFLVDQVQELTPGSDVNGGGAGETGISPIFFPSAAKMCTF